MFTEQRLCYKSSQESLQFFGKRGNQNTAFGPRLQDRAGHPLDAESTFEILQERGAGWAGDLVRQDYRAGARTFQTPTFRKPELLEAGIDLVRGSVPLPREDWILALDYGPQGDCYDPGKAPDSLSESTSHHRDNIKPLDSLYFKKSLPEKDRANTILWFETINSTTESTAIAIASLLQKDLPLAISFVVNDEGHLLDETPISEAVREIRQAGRSRFAPIFIGVNCCSSQGRNAAVHDLRLHNEYLDISYINASDKCGATLDGSDTLVNLSPNELTPLILGGGTSARGVCCGGTCDHIESLANASRRGE